MDHVFNAATPSLKAVEIRVEPAPDPANNPVAAPLPTTRLSTQPWQQLTLIGVTLGALLCSAWLTRSWQLSEQALYRERNLALTEKLKARATPSPSAPPKPAEPEAVATLPSLEPLTLPLSAAIAPVTAPSGTSPSYCRGRSCSASCDQPTRSRGSCTRRSGRISHLPIRQSIAFCHSWRKHRQQWLVLAEPFQHRRGH